MDLIKGSLFSPWKKMQYQRIKEMISSSSLKMNGLNV